MESSFFSGSENLYKYMVTIGILLVVMTVYYPLKEKQDLEIQEIELCNQVESLQIKIAENKKSIDAFKKQNSNQLEIAESKKIHLENLISQTDSKNKLLIIVSKQKYIHYYNIIFWIFFPTGIIFIAFGFYKWYKAKKIDDQKSALEKTKLELEITKLQQP